jgi:hypothetical protein
MRHLGPVGLYWLSPKRDVGGHQLGYFGKDLWLGMDWGQAPAGLMHRQVSRSRNDKPIRAPISVLNKDTDGLFALRIGIRLEVRGKAESDCSAKVAGRCSGAQHKTGKELSICFFSCGSGRGRQQVENVLLAKEGECIPGTQKIRNWGIGTRFAFRSFSRAGHLRYLR